MQLARRFIDEFRSNGRSDIPSVCKARLASALRSGVSKRLSRVLGVAPDFDMTGHGAVCLGMVR